MPLPVVRRGLKRAATGKSNQTGSPASLSLPGVHHRLSVIGASDGNVAYVRQIDVVP